MKHRLSPLAAVLLLALSLLTPKPAAALDDDHWQLANQAIDKGIVYLRSTQNEDGSWLSRPGPGVTGLVVTGMLDQPDIAADDPTVAKAIAYMMSKQQDDGSFRDGKDGILSNYNTAICLSALARVGNDPEVAEAIKKGQQYLMGGQWREGMKDKDGKPIDQNHPSFGGFGYGRGDRPDLSNTQMVLQALHDTGVDCEDPAFKRALAFLDKLQAYQGSPALGGKVEPTGGFVYVPEPSRGRGGNDQQGEADVSTLRTHGGMSYAGFKSMLYADLDRDDPRIKAVLGWIGENYKLDANPGLAEDAKLQGLFYYHMTMSRALNAWGSTTLKVKEADKTVSRDWANDLIDQLAKSQKDNGSWANTDKRWMEDQPDLATAYAIIALSNAID